MQPEEDSLHQIQIEIARALTESGMKPIDCDLLKLSASDLEQSRETLIRKRISQTRNLLPRTTLAMGLNFNTVFRDFAAAHHFNGSNAIAMDAIAFARWLSKTKIAMPWVRQLALWESMDCYWSTARIYVKFFRFQYDFAGQFKAEQFEAGGPREAEELLVLLASFRLVAKTKVIRLMQGEYLVIMILGLATETKGGAPICCSLKKIHFQA